MSHKRYFSSYAVGRATVNGTAGAVFKSVVSSLTYTHKITPVSFEIEKLLIESGADINAKDDEGCTPIFHAFEAMDMTALGVHSSKVTSDDPIEMVWKYS